jgi:hypothetical protein
VGDGTQRTHRKNIGPIKPTLCTGQIWYDIKSSLPQLALCSSATIYRVMDRFCTLCGFRTKTYPGLAKHVVRCYTQRQALYNKMPAQTINIVHNTGGCYASIGEE